MSNPYVSLTTPLGEIVLELYPQQAPKSTTNFLRYVTEDRYEGARFYRTVSPENLADNPVPSDVPITVVQGGLGLDPHPIKLPPIAHETTQQTELAHRDGTLSLGRFHPGSAQGEFFICLGDQPALDWGGRRNPDGQGFAAFGQVIAGMDVVRAIHASPARGQWLAPPIPITACRVISR